MARKISSYYSILFILQMAVLLKVFFSVTGITLDLYSVCPSCDTRIFNM